MFAAFTSDVSFIVGAAATIVSILVAGFVAYRVVGSRPEFVSLDRPG
jgi:hypothetical protein